MPGRNRETIYRESGLAHANYPAYPAAVARLCLPRPGEREGESLDRCGGTLHVQPDRGARGGNPPRQRNRTRDRHPDGTRERSQAPGEGHARFPVTTCTTCGQHYYVAFLKDFTFTGKQPGGGEAGSGNSGGSWWEPLDETFGGRRVVLVDRLIGASDETKTSDEAGSVASGRAVSGAIDRDETGFDESDDEAGSVASGRAVSDAIDRDETGFDESDDAPPPPPRPHRAHPRERRIPLGHRRSARMTDCPPGIARRWTSDTSSGAAHPPSPTHATPPPRRAADTARDAPPHPPHRPHCGSAAAAAPRIPRRCPDASTLRARGSPGAASRGFASARRSPAGSRAASRAGPPAIGSGAATGEPARPVRAINVADVHVLAQDMVHHAGRRRLLVFCDNRQDAAFQAGWMKDHARPLPAAGADGGGDPDEPRVRSATSPPGWTTCWTRTRRSRAP